MLSEAESEGMVVGKGSFASLPKLAEVSLTGVREVEDGAFLGLPELTDLTLNAYRLTFHNASALPVDEQPLLPPRLFKPLLELEDVRAYEFRWPHEQGLEVSYKQVCKIGHNIDGYNIDDFPVPQGQRWYSMRWKVNGKPAYLIASDGVSCRIGVGAQWPENEDSTEWETEVLVSRDLGLPLPR